ncbi:MAG: hypothetical protein GDA67_00920 [Nitrospira sp. CR1.3]|nr:hypothetical protein [Nitrospira sp. CR1.3]
MRQLARAAGGLCVWGLLTACNSDIPVPATAEIPSLGLLITVTRTATHPFLARYNLTLKVSAAGGCSASSELFPDTGGVSRRNLYAGARGLLYVVGQFDVRVFDPGLCMVSLREFRSLEERMKYLGTFDVGDDRRWRFFSADVRSEQPFEKP